MHMQLYCSVSLRKVKRGEETHLGEKGYKYMNFCNCHKVICQVNCLQCGLISYSNSSKHVKENDHIVESEGGENYRKRKVPSTFTCSSSKRHRPIDIEYNELFFSPALKQKLGVMEKQDLITRHEQVKVQPIEQVKASPLEQECTKFDFFSCLGTSPISPIFFNPSSSPMKCNVVEPITGECGSPLLFESFDGMFDLILE